MKGDSGCRMEDEPERPILGSVWIFNVKRAFIVEINEDQPNENKQRLFTLSLLYKGVSHHHLRFGRASKAGRGVGRLYSSEKGKA